MHRHIREASFKDKVSKLSVLKGDNFDKNTRTLSGFHVFVYFGKDGLSLKTPLKYLFNASEFLTAGITKESADLYVFRVE